MVENQIMESKIENKSKFTRAKQNLTAISLFPPIRKQ